MRYIVKQKVFSLRDKFTIKDELQKDIFQVSGKIVSLGNKLSLLDMEGNELFFIKQKLMRLLPQYELLKNDDVVATVNKRFTFLQSKFDITSPFGEFRIEGRPMGYDFKIFKNNQVIAVISKQFFSISDTYGIDIMDSEDQSFVLALVIVIDQVIHENKH